MNPLLKHTHTKRTNQPAPMLREHGVLTSDRLVTDLLSDFVLRHGHSRVVMFGLVVDSADSDATRDCRTAAGSQHLP